MKVLITGADGQVGRALRRTAGNGITLVAHTREDLDISLPDCVPAVTAIAPDVIVNAAAYTAVDQAEVEPERADAVNALGAEHLAHAAYNTGARLVQISTDFVFDGRQGRPYRPDDAPDPINVYGTSKLAGERAVRAVCANALILRTAWVYSWDGSNFLKAMLRLMRERDEVRVVDDQIGTPTSADSLAGAIWKAVEIGLEGTHHWTDAGVASWYDFAVAIRELAMRYNLLHSPVTVTPVGMADFPTRASRPAISVLDKRETYQRLGDAAHWRLALERTLREGSPGD